MAKKSACEKYGYLDRLSTDQLEELLRADFESDENSDVDAIFHILEVIEKREREHPTGRLPDTKLAWEEFQQYYDINPRLHSVGRLRVKVPICSVSIPKTQQSGILESQIQ